MIDRGPDSLGVLRLWAEGAKLRGVDRIDRLIGNHEILMLLALRGGPAADRMAATWLADQIGGSAMLAEMRDAVRDPLAPLSYELAQAAIGREILDQLMTQRSHLKVGNALFVHGGLDGRPIPMPSSPRPGPPARRRAGPGSPRASSTGRAASAAPWWCMATPRRTSTRR
jgi:serine/threonine protein phosphatase 1